MQRPLWALALTGIVALCTGISSSMFALVDARVLRPLPFANADELLLIHVGFDRRVGADEVEWFGVAPSLQRLAKITTGVARFDWERRSERRLATAVSGDFFAVLQVQPAAGRWLTPADEKSGAPVAVVSARLANIAFGGATRAIGQSMSLDGRRYEVVGVASGVLSFPAGTDAWIPRRRVPGYGLISELFERSPEASPGTSYGLVARRRPEASQALVLAEIRTLHDRHVMAAPGDIELGDVSVWRLEQLVVGDVRTGLMLLIVAVGGVLLVGGCNVAGLALAGTVDRGAGLAMRWALGAPWRSVIGAASRPVWSLVGVGAVAGVVIAWWGVDYLDESIVWGAGNRPARLNTMILGGSVLTSGGLGCVAVLSAVVLLRRRALYGLLTLGHLALSVRLASFLTAMVVGQVAMAVVLSAATVAALEELRTLMGSTVAVDGAAQVMVAEVEYPPDGEDLLAVQDGLRAFPLVQYVGAIDSLPQIGTPLGLYVRAGRRDGVASVHTVSGEAFRALGIRVVLGRGFGTGEPRDSVVISSALARALWGRSEDAVGQEMDFGDRSTITARRVVGVVEDVRHRPDRRWSGAVYVSVSDSIAFTRRMAMVVGFGGATPPSREVVRAIAAVAPRVRVTGVSTYAEMLWRMTRRERNIAGLVTALTVAVLALAACGAYGVGLYLTSLREREVGVRLVLGARLSHVVWTLVWTPLRGVLAGVAVGVGVLMAVQGLARSFVGAVPDMVDGVLAALFVGVMVVAAAVTGAMSVANRVRPVESLRAD